MIIILSVISCTLLKPVVVTVYLYDRDFTTAIREIITTIQGKTFKRI